MSDAAATPPASPVQVYYWDMHGRGGAVLRMLAEAGVAFEHIHEFPKIASVAAVFGAAKETLAPPIVVDGDVVLSQSVATSLYVGNKYGFPAEDVAKAVMLAGNIADLFENGVLTNASKGGEAFKTYMDGADGKPSRFSVFANALERSVKGPYFFGEKATWVDFFFASGFAFTAGSVLDLLSEKTGKDYLAACPKLKAIEASIRALPSAKKITFPECKDAFKKKADDELFNAFAAAEEAPAAAAEGGGEGGGDAAAAE